MYKETILEILKELHPDTDYDNQENLISDHLLDSFDIVNLITEIADRLDISIPAQDIIPENFNSVDKICSLLERIEED